MELIHVAPGGDYARYEELTLKKDQYEKEADQIHIAYLREFGELMTLSFQLKVDCIALKKEIALYVKAANTGTAITPEEVEAHLKVQMAGYYEELQRMIDEWQEGKRSKSISFYEAEQIKKIYRRLAKQLHPDISPLTAEYPALGELFNRVLIAYRCNDLKELQKLEVLVNKELEDNGVEGFNMVIPDICERIEELERDIEAIVTSAPYSYKTLLRDPDAVAEKKAELHKEIDEYAAYKQELTVKRDEMKGRAKADG